MNLVERKQSMKSLLSKLQDLKKRRDALHSLHGQMDTRRDYFSIDAQIMLNEDKIAALEEQITLFNLNAEVWAYTIMGNRKATDIYSEYFDIILNHITFEEQKKRLHSKDFYKNVINNRCFKSLIKYASQQGSRLAYQVLGVFLMRYGARMPEGIKNLILDHSRWEKEESQLKDFRAKRSRFKYLQEFREKVKNYREGEIIEITVIYITDVLEEKIRQGDDSIVDKQPIDYNI